MIFTDMLQTGVISLIIGLIVFAFGINFFKKKQMIENIPTSKVRSLAMGLAEVQGTAVALKDKILKSPFTNKNCIYYKYSVEEYHHSKNGGYWATVKSGDKRSLFWLKDKTGMVLVNPKGADIDIPKDWRFHPTLFNSSPQKKVENKIKSFFKKEKIAYTSFFGFKRNLRFTEYYIAPRDKLYILGTAGDNPHKKEASAMHSVEDIMMQQGKDEKFFYISDKHEKTLLKSLAWKVYGSLLGGGFLVVVGSFLTLISLAIL
ncbi:MAG: hypothetical protein GOV02_02815 [Candidatus Aenigmarchaeota archaeon]|nr:hypothetical protein [Candidatus Aenigmarchaeota archaeon]